MNKSPGVLTSSDPPLRVLHIDESFIGGTYKIVQSITSIAPFPAFVFSVMCGNRSGKDLAALARDFPHVRFLEWPHARRELSAFHDALALVDVVRAIQRTKPHVIHCHSSKAGVLGRLGGLITGMSRHLIYTPHGLSFLQQNESVRKRSLYKLIEQTMARVGGDIVACSHSEAATLASIGVACTVIPNGVPVGGQPAPLPKGPPFTVVTAGRLTHAKNPSLFSTIAQAFVGDDSVRFVWIGDGELRADLTSPNIEMRGWMHPDEVRATLRNAHVYLSTSLWEGLPLAVLEAMDAGLPLLLSDCVGNRDLVDAKNGYSFNTSADAVCKLRSMLQSLTALRAMGEESRLAFLKHYTVGRMVESYLAQYRSHRAIRDPDA